MADESDTAVDRQVHIITTLHFVVAGRRASTVNEAVGRASMYLTSTSMTLVALGFIGAATEMGDAFYTFAFVLLSCLILLGFVTFVRVAQTGAQDVLLARGESQIIDFYLQAAPALDVWLKRPVRGATASQLLGLGDGSRLQMLFTAASLIAAVNGAVIGVLSGLAVVRFVGLSLTWATIAGALMFALSVWQHLRIERTLFGVAFTPVQTDREAISDIE